MRNQRLSLVIIALFLIFVPAQAFAQSYSFRLDRQEVDIYWNEDGTAAVDYAFFFSNDPFASPIEYVDVAMPNPNFDVGSITAEVDGQRLTDISASGYQGTGTGVAVGLGQWSIPPGQSGRVRVFIGTISRVLFTDDQRDDYASAVFSPAYFDSSVVNGTTDMTVTFHLPPGVQPEEPRWHSAPRGFPEAPETGFDEQGRITYTWHNPEAQPDRENQFGASFPLQYVPAQAVRQPDLADRAAGQLGISLDTLIGFCMCGGFFGFIALIIFLSARSTQRRKLQYLPPKISIEGHGIKRGLTAVEAAILLEQPLDKILTMILFAIIKKGAASVAKREPLELDFAQPPPEGLQSYEKQFLDAFRESKAVDRRRVLQDLMIDLVQSVSKKMKGFSRRETLAYYRDIMNRAWAQVEAAGTPEVKSQKYDEVMEWTMLDRDYDRRTREVFRTGPVFVPTWWSRYDPTFGRGVPSQPAGTPTVSPTSTPTGGGGVSLPHLPGSDFAASMVRGVETFSAGVIGNVTDFTSRVTNKTNPVPVSTTSTRSGGGSRPGGGCACACACACAGCACACAGGGR